MITLLTGVVSDITVTAVLMRAGLNWGALLEATPPAPTSSVTRRSHSGNRFHEECIRHLDLIGALVASSATHSAPAAPTTCRTSSRSCSTPDPWGISGATMTARAILKDKRGATSQLSLFARSRRYDPPFLSKSLVRFTAPADLAGAGFLQIQKRDGDDDRFLFLPELTLPPDLRQSARQQLHGHRLLIRDLDRRDLRESTCDETSGRDHGPVFALLIHASRRGRLALFVDGALDWKDNRLPLKMKLYDRAKVLFKTFTAQRCAE